MTQTRPADTTDWTIGKLLDWTRAHFESRGVEEPRLCAEILLAKALACRRIDLYAQYERRPDDAQRTAFREMVKAAADHRPIAYLVGRKEFYSLEFDVTPDVLIPRPETEIIVEKALAHAATRTGERVTVRDVGTGSGCIAVTIAKREPRAHAIATDISEPALAVARGNAAKHGVTDRVTCAVADLLERNGGDPGEAYDIITANLPYVATADAPTLPKMVRDYEPATALFAGADGLDLFRRMAPQVAPRLRPGGLLLLEIGKGQAEAVTQLFVDAGLELTGAYADLRGIVRTLGFTLSA